MSQGGGVRVSSSTPTELGAGVPDVLDMAPPSTHNPCMRVVSWNMGMNDPRFKRPGVHDQAWHYVLGLGPDLAFLQEALPPAWVRTEGQLMCGPISKWGSIIFSPRYPLQPFRLPDESRLRAFGSYLALGTASLPDGMDAFVVSVHARAARATTRQLGDVDPATVARDSVPQPRTNDLIFFELTGLVGDRFIAAGDWNTGRTQASARAGVEFFERAHNSGWYDCVWDTFGREERTWFREGDALIQDDHAFCDPSLGHLVRGAWAADEAALRLGLSDHAPLILDFDVDSIAMKNLIDEPDLNDSP